MTKEKLITLNDKFDKIVSISLLKRYVGKILTQKNTILSLIETQIKPNGEFDTDILKMFIDPDEIEIGEQMIENIIYIVGLLEPLESVNNIELLFPKDIEETNIEQ